MQSSEGENERECRPERKIERRRQKNYKATRATIMQREKDMVAQVKKPKKMVDRIKLDTIFMYNVSR